MFSDPSTTDRGDELDDGEETLGLGDGVNGGFGSLLPYILIFLEWRLMADVPLGLRTSGLECRLAIVVPEGDGSCCD